MHCRKHSFFSIRVIIIRIKIVIKQNKKEKKMLYTNPAANKQQKAEYNFALIILRWVRSLVYRRWMVSDLSTATVVCNATHRSNCYQFRPMQLDEPFFISACPRVDVESECARVRIESHRHINTVQWCEQLVVSNDAHIKATVKRL